MNAPVTPEMTAAEDAAIDAAKADYSAFLDDFQKKHGYGVGAVSVSEITPQGFIKVNTLMQLVKLPPTAPADNGADTTQNGNDTAKETGTGDSAEQPAG